MFSSLFLSPNPSRSKVRNQYLPEDDLSESSASSSKSRSVYESSISDQVPVSQDPLIIDWEIVELEDFEIENLSDLRDQRPSGSTLSTLTDVDGDFTNMDEEKEPVKDLLFPGEVWKELWIKRQNETSLISNVNSIEDLTSLGRKDILTPATESLTPDRSSPNRFTPIEDQASDRSRIGKVFSWVFKPRLK